MQSATKSTLCALVEEQITSLVRDAVSVQRHTKRARLCQTQTSDKNSNDANNISTELQFRRTLQADDVDLALQFRGCPKMLTTNAGNVMKTSEKVDLNAYVKSEIKHSPPSEIGMIMHWLAVDGVQPNIPQNPIDVRRGGADQAGIIHNTAGEDEEDHVVRNGNNGTNASSSTISVRQLLPRLLSEELRLYFTRVKQAIERGGPLQQDVALLSVSRDSGIQELVPFFCEFASRQILDNIGQTQYCLILIRLTRALISNPHLHLELHLQQILPPIMTCTVAKKLSSGPWDDHWSLRDEASRTLVKLCRVFGVKYPKLKPSLLDTLYRAILPEENRPGMKSHRGIIREKPLGMQYGGIVAISSFGPKVIDSLILRLVAENWVRWQEQLYDETDLGRRYDLHRCSDALLNTMVIFLGEVNVTEQAKRLNHDHLSDVFGDQLVPIMSNRHDSEYFSCIL